MTRKLPKEQKEFEIAIQADVGEVVQGHVVFNVLADNESDAMRIAGHIAQGTLIWRGMFNVTKEPS